MSTARKVFAVALFVTICALLVAITVGELAGYFAGELIFVVPMLMGGFAGLFLTLKRPDNSIGLVILIGNVAILVAGTAESFGGWFYENGWLPASAIVTLLGNLSFVVFAVALLVLLPLWFPDGRAISRRWAWVGRVAIAATVAAFLLVLPTEELCYIDPDGACHGSVTNPWGIPGWDGGAAVGVMVFVALAMAIPALVAAVVRWLRSTGTERQQLKWFSAGALSLALAFALVLIPGPQWIASVGLVAGFTALWVALAVAVLRYRLYEIDRIINRTVVYAIVVGLLGAVFVAGAVWLPTVLPFDNNVAVAASTLAVFFSFNPLRVRVQRMVDRRFYRSRYDAQEVADAFSVRLRDQVDPEAVASEWAEVVQRTLHPAAVAVWVREEA